MDLDKIIWQFRAESQKIKGSDQVEKLRLKYLGRKGGILPKITEKIPHLSLNQRSGIGTQIKKIRSEIEDTLTKIISEKLLDHKSSFQDVTIPGQQKDIGSLHPITQVIEEVKDIFQSLGFSWVDGPEVESDEYNFQKLNMPPEHPARDTQQTYYIDEKILLRTHTSNIQVRYLEKNKPPVRILAPGRAYRRDMPDATHLPFFYQIEGLLIDDRSSITELLGSLDFFVKRFFGKNTKTRVYGHNFPYTEPSIEIEVYHPKSGWIEILGAGMVHPQILQNAQIDPKKYRGWAFGMGPDRLVMLKYGIDDLRILYNNRIGFLNQF